MHALNSKMGATGKRERELVPVSEKILVIYLMHILSTAHYHLVDYEG
jgi:hypothetical protein